MATLDAATDMPDVTAGANDVARDEAGGSGRDQQQGGASNQYSPGNVLKKISEVMKVSPHDVHLLRGGVLG